MSSRSGNLTREVLTIVLFFVCIVSGGTYLALHKEKPAAIQLAFGGSGQAKNVNAIAVNTPNKNNNTLPTVANQNAPEPTQNANVAPSTANVNTNVQVNQNIASPVVNVNTNSVGNSTPPPVTTPASLQAFAQTKLGKDYLVVKTEYKENKIFETLTPYATAVAVDRYILQKNGEQVGYLYEMKKVDATIRNVNLFLRDLAQRVLQNSKVTVSDASYGRRGFYYNNIEKSELLRIVVESKSGGNYAIDVPSKLKEDFNEFFRSL